MTQVRREYLADQFDLGFSLYFAEAIQAEMITAIVKLNSNGNYEDNESEHDQGEWELANFLTVATIHKYGFANINREV